MKTKWIIIISTSIIAILTTIFLLFNFLKGKGINSTTVEQSNGTPNIEQKEGYISIPIFYGANRGKNKGYLDNLFNGKYVDSIHYGYFRVSIPDTHIKGDLESPDFFERLKGKRYNPKKYINIIDNKNLSEREFHNTLKETLNDKKSNQAFIFIHGYNNTFTSAAQRTAQLFFDLKYEGTPIMYSWPSVAKTHGYLTDAKQIEKSVILFEKFLIDISKKNPDKKLNIIAHSMGNRLLVNAINKIKDKNPDIKFENIIMAAPDVSKDHFTKKHYRNMIKSSKNITLYCSENDIALKASKIVNMQSRLGFGGKNIFKKDSISTVDISNLDKCGDFLKHTCFAQTNYVIDDISNILQNKNLDRKLNNGISYILNKETKL